MADDTILETRGLTKEFKGFVAVRNVSLSVRRGTIHALIGPNGAGKTTCFNLLTHFLTPTQRPDLLQRPRHHRARVRPGSRGWASCGRSRSPPSFRTSRCSRTCASRCSASAAASFDFWRAEDVLTELDPRARELIDAVGLAEFTDTEAVLLSYGRKRALEIATTLALDPEMMLLDEPTAGMAHEDVERISTLIKKVAKDRTVLMVEHNLSVVVEPVGPHHGARARRDPRAGQLRDGVDESRRRAGLHGRRPCLTSQGTAAVSPPAAAGAPLLSVRGLNAWYGESHILHGVDFDVASGEVVTLLGRNGAGKTTTLRAIMGIVPRREGSITFEGAETVRLPSNRIARRGIAYCPEERGIFASLNVEENLLLPPIVREGGLPLEQIFELFPNLKERRASQGTKLSGGEQQMLAIGRILRTGARLLLLDEPTEGLAPVIVQQIGRTITKLKAQGFTILLVEQNFRFAATVADRHYVIEHGRVADMIRNADLDANMDKLHDYLGV